MRNYDFKVLSPIDFENLVRDLLQKQLKITLESFSSGRDTGIDFRYISLARGKVIVQCKHTPEANFASLLSGLRRTELPKVQKLSPDRYIFATSQPLTPPKKQRIVELFSPYILNSSDVYGREDLNNLLGKFKSVERDHVKLWISNSIAMERFLHTRRLNLSREALSKIRHDAQLYVQNDSFSEALKILERFNVCLIVGVPGIGKTMLAEMLLLRYHSIKFEIVKIENDIKEASDVDYVNRKRIFYYDDFLGQASVADKLQKNEDQSLINFMTAIKRSKVSKLILTTREYILNQSKLVYEKMDRTGFNLETCVIDLSKYTRLNRAKILFNHIYFSRLPRSYQNALLSDKSYLRIIDHENYNPRIIETLTEMPRLADVKPREYVARFISSLDNPEFIWSHAFSSQLLPESRDLLVILVTSPTDVLLADLESAFILYRKKNPRSGDSLSSSEAFRRALKELDGNFIATENAGNGLLVRFQNPSVRDFLQNYLSVNPDVLEAVVRSIICFDQIYWIWNHKHPRSDRYRFRKIIRDRITREFLLKVKISLQLPSYSLTSVWNKGKYIKVRHHVPLAARISQIASVARYLKTKDSRELLERSLTDLNQAIDSNLIQSVDLVNLLNNLKGCLRRQSWADLLSTTKALLTSSLNDLEDYQALVRFNRRYPRVFSESEFEKLSSSFPKFAEKFVRELTTGDPDDLRTYSSEISWIGDEFGIDVDGPVSELEDAARESEEMAEEKEKERERNELTNGLFDRDDFIKQMKRSEREVSDQEIDSIFSALV